MHIAMSANNHLEPAGIQLQAKWNQHSYPLWSDMQCPDIDKRPQLKRTIGDLSYQIALVDPRTLLPRRLRYLEALRLLFLSASARVFPITSCDKIRPPDLSKQIRALHSVKQQNSIFPLWCCWSIQ